MCAFPATGADDSFPNLLGGESHAPQLLPDAASLNQSFIITCSGFCALTTL